MRTDNEIWLLIFSAITNGLIARGLSADVVQSYQITQQGVPDNHTVALHSIDSRRYGFPRDEDYWDVDALVMRKKQSYWLERTYQVDALIGIADTRETAPTAFDYIDAVSSLLQTADTLKFLHDNDIGILRIQPLRVTYFVDDKGRHEQVPSFDFTLVYKQILLSDTVPVDRITANIYEV